MKLKLGTRGDAATITAVSWSLSVVFAIAILSGILIILFMVHVCMYGVCKCVWM